MSSSRTFSLGSRWRTAAVDRIHRDPSRADKFALVPGQLLARSRRRAASTGSNGTPTVGRDGRGELCQDLPHLAWDGSV